MMTTQASISGLLFVVYLHFSWFRLKQFTEHSTVLSSTPALHWQGLNLNFSCDFPHFLQANVGTASKHVKPLPIHNNSIQSMRFTR